MKLPPIRKKARWTNLQGNGEEFHALNKVNSLDEKAIFINFVTIRIEFPNINPNRAHGTLHKTLISKTQLEWCQCGFYCIKLNQIYTFAPVNGCIFIDILAKLWHIGLVEAPQ